MSTRVFWQAEGVCPGRLKVWSLPTPLPSQTQISAVNVVKPFPSPPRMDPNNINNQLPDDTWGCFQHQRKTDLHI